MKTKKMGKKLNLNKITINTMDNEQLNHVGGGLGFTQKHTCDKLVCGPTEYAYCTLIPLCVP